MLRCLVRLLAAGLSTVLERALISIELAQTPANRGGASSKLCALLADSLPIRDDRGAAFGEQRLSRLRFDGLPAGALERIGASAHLVLQVVQGGLQLRIAPIELGERVARLCQIPLERVP